MEFGIQKRRRIWYRNGVYSSASHVSRHLVISLLLLLRRRMNHMIACFKALS